MDVTADGGQDTKESMLAPWWARAAIGAGAATIAVLIMYAVSASVRGPMAQSGNVVIAIFVLLMPFLLGAAISVIADLDRPQPRLGLAVASGASLAIASFMLAAISTLLIPLAPAVTVVLRVIISPPHPTFGRLESALLWSFSVTFWTAFADFAGRFVLLHRPGLRELILSAGAALFGAVFTIALMHLDPDRPADDEGAVRAA